MNQDFLIKTTNRVALYATVALIYWVFVFLIVTVFDLKIFRGRMTETFFLSLLGIFAILGGAIILNVMSNLSKISAAISLDHSQTPERSNRGWIRIAVIALSFPVLAGLLFVGNEYSAQKKKNLLIQSAEKLVSENQTALAVLADYKFSREYVKKAESTLGVIKKIDKNLPEVMLIVPDAIEEKKLFLAFGRGSYYDRADRLEKSEFIFSASQSEREYLQKVYTSSEASYRFHADAGNYQLFFPVLISGRKVVLYFSDQQRYGKLGS